MFHHRLSALLAAFSIMAGGSASAQQQTSTPLGDLLGVLKTIEVGVDDQVATMILDTGGGVTVVTPELAERMGCQPWGQLSGFRLSGERLSMTRCSAAALRIGDKLLATQEVGVFDLAALLPPEAPRIDGILSLDALSATPFTLELDAGRLTLETPESLAARTSDAIEIPIRLHRQRARASQ